MCGIVFQIRFFSFFKRHIRAKRRNGLGSKGILDTASSETGRVHGKVWEAGEGGGMVSQIRVVRVFSDNYERKEETV